jgi:polyhydroxybutyrate depolymerase
MARRLARITIAATAVAVVAAACGRVGAGAASAPKAPGPSSSTAGTTVELTSGGLDRTYILDVPAVAPPAGGWPLILLLHGGGGTADRLATATGGFPAEANARGYVVARPQGRNKQWNDGRPQVGAVDDVAFLADVVADVGRRLALNPGRTYAAGISNGAMMTGRLACTPTFRLAAVAQVVGTIGVDVADDCRPAGPTSVLVLMGRVDPIVPYAGGDIRIPLAEPGSHGAVVGAEAYAASWVARLATPTRASTITIAPDARAQVTLGADATELEFATIDDGGHGWPGGTQYLPRFIVGNVVQTFSANTVILDFFDRHP